MKKTAGQKGNQRSRVMVEGAAKGPHRSLFKAMGFTDKELSAPLVGIACAYNEIIPGHIHLDKIAQAVKDGVRMAGGTPIMFGTDVRKLVEDEQTDELVEVYAELSKQTREHLKANPHEQSVFAFDKETGDVPFIVCHNRAGTNGGYAAMPCVDAQGLWYLSVCMRDSNWWPGTGHTTAAIDPRTGAFATPLVGRVVGGSVDQRVNTWLRPRGSISARASGCISSDLISEAKRNFPPATV